MSIKRWAARSDANRGEIVAALKAFGCSVYDLRQPVDLLVGTAGKTMLMEVKRPKAKGQTAGKATGAQEAFMATWNGGAVCTVDSVEAALRAVAVMRM